MADSYLSISAIANDEYMIERLRACATQQVALGNLDETSAIDWVEGNRYLWASSPGWGEAWTYALNTHNEETDYEPGLDEAVITDGMILAAVQALGDST